MSWSSVSARRAIVACLLITVVVEGCDSPSEPQPVVPKASPSETNSNVAVMVVEGSSGRIVTPGETLTNWPVVKVEMRPSRRPVEGVIIQFAIGSASPISVTTDANGLARLPSWTIGSQPGEYSVTASADGGLAAKATALVMNGPAISMSFELESMGGKTLPQSFSGGGATWDITGGQYELMADGTYYWDYYADGVRRSPRDRPIGRYEVLADGVIRFYMDPSRAPQSIFYAERGYLFSTGHLSEGTMTVVYEDFIDFEKEIYVLRR